MMLKEEISRFISKNWKLVSNSVLIDTGIPRIFTFGSFINSTAKVIFHSKNFKKMLSKLGMDSLPVKVVVTYLGYGFITKFSDEKNGLEISFFGARKAVLAETDYQEVVPGAKISVPFLSTPYLVLPSISLVRPAKKTEDSKLAGVFVVHKYSVDVYTKAEGEDILLLGAESTPNVLFPPFNRNVDYPAFQDLFNAFKKYYQNDLAGYFHELRRSMTVIESPLDELPLRIMILAPYNKVERVDPREKTEEMIKKYGYGNIAILEKININDWEKTKERILNLIRKIKPQNMFQEQLRIVIAPRGDVSGGDNITINISTGVTVEIGGKIIHETDWNTRKKFKIKDFKKRKELKFEIKVPIVGSSFIYIPDNEDVKYLYEITKGVEKKIYSYSEFDALARELINEGLLIENFKKGFAIYPHVKISVERNGEEIFEQLIPQIYSVEHTTIGKK